MSSKDLIPIKIKQFNDKNIEIFGTKDELLFNPKQISDVLDIANTFEYVDNDLKVIHNLGSGPEFFVTEEGLYQILFMTNTPKAKAFRKWTTNVIKDIRKTTQKKLEQLEAFTSKKYEEVKKTGCNYTLRTDSCDFFKNGMSKHVDSKSRVSAHQSSNEKDIEVLHEFPTSCPALLEKCVHYCLEMYRSNSGREFFSCKLDHIKNIVDIIGHVLDTCRSSFESISRKELLEKIFQKLHGSLEVNLNPTECEDEDDEVAHWVNRSIIYENGAELTQVSLNQNYFFNNPRVGVKEKGKFRQQVERVFTVFKKNDINFNVKLQYLHRNVKGWANVKLI